MPDGRREATHGIPFPYTKTGYIRKRVKQALYPTIRYAAEKQSDFDLYVRLRQAFRGGNTHANRAIAGRIIHGVKAYDRASSYPDVMVNCRFPTGNFFRCQIENFDNLWTAAEYALLFELEMWNVQLKDSSYPVPYISLDKCRKVLGAVLDNGRIMAADHLIITVTDIDYDIICQQYDFSQAVNELWASRYDYLPSEIRTIVIDLYHAKTSLKNVPGRESEYASSKEDINSCYGMCVQDPGKPEIIFNGADYIKLVDQIPETYREMISNTPLLYCWGVWITAWARYRLEEVIRMAGNQMVYCDTDSVFIQGDIDLTEYNAQRVQASTRSGAVATDPAGIEHPMGVFELDKICDEFITYGAKKYAYTRNGVLKITIAGVNKKKGAEELLSAGGLAALKPGFVFRKAGGTASWYNDTEYGPLKVEGGEVNVTRNIYIQDTEYTLGITDEYRELIKNPRVIDELKLRLKENSYA